MKTHLLTLTLAACVVASANAANIHVNAVKTIPRSDSVTTAGRPSLHNGIIAFGQTPPNNVGVTYDTKTEKLTTWGSTDDPVDMTRNVLGFFQNEQTGVGGNWAVVGGAPEGQSLSVPIKVIDLVKNTRIDVYPDSTVANGTDQHFFDINTNGDLVWVDFGPGTADIKLIWTNMKDPTVQIALPTATGGTSQHPRLSTESGRRIVYSPSSTSHRIFALDTMSDYSIYESTTGENVLRARISDDGNWVIANHRPADETLKRSDLILINVTDLTKPVSFNLTKDPTVIREDPNIEIVDADSAIVVWGQDSTPDTEDNYDIYAAVVTGLSQNTPVMGTPVLLAPGDGGAGRGNRFPVIDATLLAWSYHWGDETSQTVQYMSIADQSPLPEPHILKWRKTTAAFELTFQTEAGSKYTVEFSESVKPPLSWSALPFVMATASETTVTNPDPAPTVRFYRVRAERP